MKTLSIFKKNYFHTLLVKIMVVWTLAMAPAYAIGFLPAMLVGIAMGFVNKTVNGLINDEHTYIHNAASLGVGLVDRNNEPVTSIPPAQEQHLVILEGLKFNHLVPAIDGYPVGEMAVFHSTQNVKRRPWMHLTQDTAGDEFILGYKTAREKGFDPAWFDTGSGKYELFRPYTWNIVVWGIRDGKVDADTPATAQLSFTVVNRAVFERAARADNPEWMLAQYLTQSAGAPRFTTMLLADDQGHVAASMDPDDDPRRLLQAGLMPRLPMPTISSGTVKVVIPLITSREVRVYSNNQMAGADTGPGIHVFPNVPVGEIRVEVIEPDPEHVTWEMLESEGFLMNPTTNKKTSRKLLAPNQEIEFRLKMTKKTTAQEGQRRETR